MSDKIWIVAWQDRVDDKPISASRIMHYEDIATSYAEDLFKRKQDPKVSITEYKLTRVSKYNGAWVHIPPKKG